MEVDGRVVRELRDHNAYADLIVALADPPVDPTRQDGSKGASPGNGAQLTRQPNRGAVGQRQGVLVEPAARGAAERGAALAGQELDLEGIEAHRIGVGLVKLAYGVADGRRWQPEPAADELLSGGAGMDS